MEHSGNEERVPVAWEDRLAGTLLGTALGDALGLPAERLTAAAIQRRWGGVDRFHFLGRTGFVSDDTEQAALLAQCLAHAPEDPEQCARLFGRALVGSFLRLPWSVGRATIRACCRAMAGARPSGVPSAGNGAAMRAAVLGVFFAEDPERRLRFGSALATVTHTDPRAVDGALFVAELAGACARSGPGGERTALLRIARQVVADPVLLAAIDRADELAGDGSALPVAAAELGTSGYVVHTVSLALHCFLRPTGQPPLQVLSGAIACGGDTDSTAAILGGWLGALYGESGLPAQLIGRIQEGPFGASHLRALGHYLAAIRRGEQPAVPGYSPAAALARNILLYPVVLGHAVRRTVPW